MKPILQTLREEIGKVYRSNPEDRGDPYSPHNWWIFDAKQTSPKTCPVCQSLEGSHYRGDELHSAFPYHIQKTANKIKAKVHPHCVPPDTLVNTSDGVKPIQDVSVGDYVLTHKGRYQPVIQLHKNKFEGDLYNIGEEQLTGNHPVLTTKGWVSPDSFNSLGENVLYLNSEDFKPENLKDIGKEQYKGYVYNLSVAKDESYTIGNRGLIVHNCRCLLIWTGYTKDVVTNPYGILKRKRERVTVPKKIDLSPSQSRMFRKVQKYSRETWKRKKEWNVTRA